MSSSVYGFCSCWVCRCGTGPDHERAERDYLGQILLPNMLTRCVEVLVVILGLVSCMLYTFSTCASQTM